VNFTGHGWRKLMRHPASFVYHITALPPIPPVLQFIVEKAGLDLSEAYGTLNMGAGFALFVPKPQAARTIAVAEQHGVKAYQVGKVEEGKKQVVVEPLGIIYEGESLNLRG
jgi:phosphoribosylformylglycinamidine cyclo-ligase